MRAGLFLTAIALLGLTTPAAAADPPIVYQTQPVGRLLDEFRGAALLVGGDKAVEAVNESIKKALGEKGFEGLDLTRPVVGYVVVPADPKDAVAVLAFPVVGEKEFLDFCERWNKGKPKALPGGLYELPPLDPSLKAVVRVADGYAYIATAAKDPSATLDPKAIVPAAKLLDASEQALAVGRVYFDRFPPELRAKAAEYLKGAAKAIDAQQPPGAPPAWKDIFGQFAKLSDRYAELSKGAKEAALRLNLDQATGDVTSELSLTANPGTPLDKTIAGIKPVVNRFAGLLTADTVAGFKVRLPFFNEELRAGAVGGLEEARKQAANNAPQNMKALADEALQGAIRTVKTGEVDVAAVLRGPDKNGKYTVVAAVAFEDPSAMAKELKKFIDAEAPPQFKDAIKWDAAKAGTVSIHTVDVAAAAGGFLNEAKRAFGENMALGFAFAPKAIYLAFGPDPVGAIKDALGAKPAAGPGLDMVVNSSRLVDFVAAVADAQAAAQVGMALGKEDKLISAASVAVTGGKELKVTLKLNLKVLPRALGMTFLGSTRSEPAAVEKK